VYNAIENFKKDRGLGLIMRNREEEAMEIFKALSAENQANLLMYARLAYIAECAVKKSQDSLLEQENEETFFKKYWKQRDTWRKEIKL
jgi:hypothetical protein